MSHKSKLVVRLLLTIAMLVSVLAQMDLKQFSALVSSMNLTWVFLAFSLRFLVVVPAVQRWRLILQNFGIRTGFAPLARLSFIGSFFNLFLPTGIGGDFVRAYYLSRNRSHEMSTVLTTLLLERSGGLCALLLIGTLSSSLGGLEVSGIPMVGLFFLLLVGYALANASIFHPWIHGQIAIRLQRWRFDSVENKMRLIYDGLKTLGRNGKAMASVLSLSLLIQFSSIVIMWLLAQGIGVATPFVTFLVFIPLINLTIMVPLTINGIGLRESAYYLLFSQVGLPAEMSVTLSLLSFLAHLLVGLPGAVFYTLHKKGDRLTQFTRGSGA